MTTKEGETMDAIQTIAIAKLIGDKAEKEARKGIVPGTFPTDFLLHVTGNLDIGGDYTRRVPQKAKPWELVAVALSHLNGVTVESIVREALTADPKMVADIKARADSAVASIKGLTETLCAGRVKADLAAEIVSALTMRAAA